MNHDSEPSADQPWREREAALLAPYAVFSSHSAGRKHPEPPHPYRAPFQRDRDRITHSAAFRRLSHKMQVFTGDMGDHHRTRLTHTLEVVSISRNLGRALRLNEDLIEALALAHDLGHPPFGHTGEEILNECLADAGGFNHNAHALRIVEELEERYPDFPGLNLSIEVLEGQTARARKSSGEVPSLEAQVVDAADSAAYDTHDADDALDLKLLSLDELLSLSLWKEAALRVRRRYTALSGRQLERALLNELIDWQVGDLLTQTRRRLAERGIDSPQAARKAGVLVLPNAQLAEPKQELERFLHERVYRHPRVIAMRSTAQGCLREMYDFYLAHLELMPERFCRRAEQIGPSRAVGDYLAGMTDRYAQEKYAECFPASKGW